MAYSDRELLARLIQCEAGGEGENGMKAVAGVVMNRVNARGGEYARGGGESRYGRHVRRRIHRTPGTGAVGADHDHDPRLRLRDDRNELRGT